MTPPDERTPAVADRGSQILVQGINTRNDTTVVASTTACLMSCAAHRCPMVCPTVRQLIESYAVAT